VRRPVLAALGVLVFAACLAGLTLGLLAVRRALPPAARSAAPLTAAQTTALRAAITLLRKRGLAGDASLAAALLQQGKWHAAGPDDPSLAQAEHAGGTPYAYTLADGKKIVAVVLAPRFFGEATPTARAALMVHEMGHVRAYLKTGRSDEYDGYRREYDTHAQLGLTARDGLPYWAMLDGVTQYVLPRAPAYKSRPDVKAFLAQSGER